MKIKRFSLNENYYPENTFIQKMEEDYDVLSTIKGIITRTMENIEGEITDDKDEFEELILNNISVDVTDIIDFNTDQQIDLCIYAEETDGTSKCPETTWNDLAGVIEKYAVTGLQYIADDKIRTDFLEPFQKFMEDNELEYGDIRTQDSYGHSAPRRVRSIENGEIYEYRKLDGDFNVDEYVYENDELGITLYIKKVL